MAGELLKEGLTMRHVIGKGMAHKYNAESVKEIWAWVKKTWKIDSEVLPKKYISRPELSDIPLSNG